MEVCEAVEREVVSFIALRMCYPMAGTDVGRGHTQLLRYDRYRSRVRPTHVLRDVRAVSGTDESCRPTQLRCDGWRYEMSGTDAAYVTTRTVGRNLRGHIADSLSSYSVLCDVRY
eukprot:2571710-Rhodomonas_salina.1